MTFAIFAYQQEGYIRDAVAGAFSQTYSNLQIILSDDCSSDGTFGIMTEMAESYRGCHQVVLNRNEENLGVAEHINRVIELCEGELIVAAAGDDISEPHRVEETVTHWLQKGGGAMSLYSGVTKIDGDGVASGTRNCQWFSHWDDVGAILSGFPTVEGASQAWHVESYRRFPPLRPDLIYEDKTVPFRMALLGSVEYIDQPLVRYRVGVGVTGSYAEMSFRERVFGIIAQRFLQVATQRLHDLRHFNPSHPNIPMAEMSVLTQQYIIELSTGKPLKQVVAALAAFRRGVAFRQIAKYFIYFWFPSLSEAMIRMRLPSSRAKQ